MKKSFTTGLVVFIILVVVIALISKYMLAGITHGDSFPGSGDRVALIYVEGTIMGDSAAGSSPWSGMTVSSVELVQALEKARTSADIKAVLLRINSPGGSAAASNEIYDEIVKVKADKPVVVSMGDVCASGGYYISSPASYIFTSPSTLTGSIGVLFDVMEFSGLMEKYGVRSDTVKAGEFKDIGSPTRPMKDNERQMLQQMLDQVHEQFIQAVATGRSMELDEVRKLATGMIYTGETAVQLKLADELGGLEAAKDKARELAGLPKDAKVVPFERKKSMFDLFSMLGSNSRGSITDSFIAPSTALEVLARSMLLRDLGVGVR
jgi:protease-4